jgi:hypothetical protein
MGKVVVFIIVLGVAIYLAIRFVQRPGNGPDAPRAPRRPVAPDDDPSFLRDLDTQLWQERRQRREPPDESP